MSSLTRRQVLVGAALAAPGLALSPSRTSVANAAALPPLVPALAAKAVYESYGINTHFSFLQPTSVWANTDAAAQWILDLRAGAVRQKLTLTTHGRAAIKQAMDKVATAGVRWCCPIVALADAGTLADARTTVNNQLDWLQGNTDLALLDSLPGPNEPNASGISNWAQRTRWAMQALWEETRKRSAFNSVKIQGAPLMMKGGPSQLSPDVAALGSISAWIDRGDVHLYPSDEDPEYQVDERLAVLKPMHAGKPICVSEGGYTTAIGRGYTGGAWLVTPEAAAIYAPKHMLVHAMDGRMFFAYELLDDAAPYANTDVATREAGFGLVTTGTVTPSAWRRKPGFDSTRRLLELVRDSTVRTPVGLRVQVTAKGTTLRSALMHRSDGKHLLAIWQAADVYEWDRRTLTGRYLNVPALTVTITLEKATPVSVFEPATRDTAVNSFTATTFNQTLGTGMQVLRIG